ncbi:MAG: hypothetical protein HY518_01440 [Candidatus Aenigmarchaeota archaeon]|nr:hypothetical protein [Candidatus Aenigmarchaeota archaeon]
MALPPVYRENETLRLKGFIKSFRPAPPVPGKGQQGDTTFDEMFPWKLASGTPEQPVRYSRHVIFKKGWSDLGREPRKEDQDVRFVYDPSHKRIFVVSQYGERAASVQRFDRGLLTGEAERIRDESLDMYYWDWERHAHRHLVMPAVSQTYWVEYSPDGRVISRIVGPDKEIFVTQKYRPDNPGDHRRWITQCRSPEEDYSKMDQVTLMSYLAGLDAFRKRVTEGMPEAVAQALQLDNTGEIPPIYSNLF